MTNYSRRQVLKLVGGSALSGSAFLSQATGSIGKSGFAWAAEATSATPEAEKIGQLADPGPSVPFPLLGKLAPRSGKQIAASPLSVGFETLDRKMFDPERAYPHLTQLGVKWARVQTGWCRCEPEKGRYEFGWLDAVVDRLLEIGIQPWFNLGYGNRLYTPEAKDVSAVGWAPIFTEEARIGWTRFVQALAKHFAQRVRHWEIWNEPNISTFWKPRKPHPKDYVDLVKLTAPVIRQEVSQAVLIGGAFAGMPLPYLQECLQAGLADHVDRHFLPSVPAAAGAELRPRSGSIPGTVDKVSAGPGPLAGRMRLPISPIRGLRLEPRKDGVDRRAAGQMAPPPHPL